jgi:curli biogenesis system outer membrane secretion channel CsgG
MALTHCFFNGEELPLQFEVQPVLGIRMAIEDTITSTVIQSLSYYTGDEIYEFTCNGVSSEIKNVFVTAFKNSDIVPFIDYDSITIQAILLELNIREVAGNWDIKGRMRRMPDYE